jgi:hypothetical protein
MRMVYQAADQPPKDRADYWHVIGDKFRPMDIRFDDVPSPGDQLVTGTLGAIQVAESTVSPGEVRRTAKHVSSSDPELYQLVAQVSGSVLGEQGGRRVELSRVTSA